MEHNAEKIIQQKIKAVEQIPVNWNKERVWSSINKARPARSYGYVFYYAAASVLLAGALIFYSIQVTRREELDKQISLLELAIEKQAGAASSSASTECLVNDVKLSTSEYFLSERKADEKMFPNEPIPVYLTSPIQSNDDFSDSLSFLQSELTDPASGGTEPIVPIASQNTIEPIIRDYLPEAKDNAVASKSKRKMKVRFFSTPEKGPLDAEESAPFILARIK